MFFTDHRHVLPELGHVLLLCCIFVEFLPVMEDLRDISDGVEGMHEFFLYKYRLVFFLRNNHMMINCKHRSMINHIVPCIKLTLISPISNPNNRLTQRRLSLLPNIFLKNPNKIINIKFILMNKHKFQTG